MSLQAQRAVNISRLEPSLRHLALALAFYESEPGGTIRPGIRTIAQALGCTERQVYRGLRALVDRHILIAIGWHQRTRCYRLDRARLAAYQPAAATPDMGLTPDMDVRGREGGVRNLAPDMGVNRPLTWVSVEEAPILISDLKEDLNTSLTCVPVLPVVPAPATASQASKPPQVENEDQNDQSPTGTEERVAARVTALLDTFKALHLEHRGEAYRERTSDRDKAGDLVRDYDLPDLATMTRTMLTDPGDRWIAQSDRSLSVLHHKAKTLLNVVKPARRQMTSSGNDWDVVLDYLRGQLSTNDWYTWWRNPTRQLDSDGDVVTVEIDGVEERGWIERHYAAQLKAALAHAGLSRVEFVIARPAAVAKTG